MADKLFVTLIKTLIMPMSSVFSLTEQYKGVCTATTSCL